MSLATQVLFPRRPCSVAPFLLFSSSPRQAGSAALLVFLTLFTVLTRGATFASDVQLLTPTRSPKLLRGPYLQLGTPTSVIIRWRTEEPSSSVVRYGPAPGVARFAEVAAGATRDHVVLLSGLAPNTRYFYAIGTTNWILSA